jgi:hypothetical protein
MVSPGSAVLSPIAGAKRPQVSMKVERRRPVSEQEVVWGKGNRDKSVNVQDEAPSLERRLKRNPA